MSRPAQLEAQIARVQEIQDELAKGDNPNVELNEDGTPKESTPPDSNVEPPVSEPPVTVTKEEYDKLEQRYRTLQGMHSADNNRLNNELKSALNAISDLENRLVAAEKAASKQVVDPVKYITAEDETEYGDTLDMVRRAAREEAENIANKREEALLERIAQLQEQVGHVSNTVVPQVENMTRARQDQIKAEFWSTIDTQVPNWRTINDNADFKAWLIAEDPLTGATRQQFLRNAQEQYNASRVVNFFKEWERIQAGGQTPAPKKIPNSELEKLVAPGASKGSTTDFQVEPKRWTRAEIAEFYKDVAVGKYATNIEGRKKIEADIFAAQREGRVS